MQNELNTAGYASQIQILGMNKQGAHSGVTNMCLNRDIPLVQDEAAADAWGLWEAALRDVIILDVANNKIQVYNLVQNPLSEPTASDPNYNELKGILIQSANGP